MPETARRAALETLERCRKDGAWSAAALDGVLKRHALDHRDAALTARLCLGVLQNSSFCDYYIELYSHRRADSLQPRLRDVLRLGVYQLLFLDKIPARAAVNESVALCSEVGLERAKGLVNAVLRRIAENRESLPPVPNPGSAAYLSTRYSHALWLVERLLSEHDYAFVEGFLSANNREPGLTIQINTLKISPEEYSRALNRAEIPFQLWPELPGCLHLYGGAVNELPGYEEGLFYVQDRAARCAVEVSGVQPGMRVLDVCAAPGGKSFAAALRMKNSGSILSCDIHEKKLRRIEQGAKRLGIDCLSVQPGDARALNPAFQNAFDLVIADVPCSGLGVIGKRPEIRFKSETELAALPEIQLDILRTVSSYVRPGGVLLYSTCTILEAENRDNVESFLNQNPNYSAEEFSIGEIHSQKGMYSFWPHVDGTDGFFVAKLRRRE